MPSTCAMETHVRYLARSSIFETEQAFQTDYPVDHVNGARRTNHEADDRPMIVAAIEDLSQWKLDRHGFCFLHGDTHLEAPDVYNKKREVQDAYCYEIEAILHSHFPQYSRIESFDLTVRVTAYSLDRRCKRTLVTDRVRLERGTPTSLRYREATETNTSSPRAPRTVIIPKTGGS